MEVDKIQKNERIGAMVKILSDFPGKVFTLGTFSEMFGAAKSTISEDIGLIQEIMGKFELGTIETVAGAAGGVRFIPEVGRIRTADMLGSLCKDLSDRSRILPGGYLYMYDIIYDPVRVNDMAKIFATRFFAESVDYVVTVETKGIPLAFTTARMLNVPLVIARHYTEASDGPSVNINYVSGSSNRIQSMVLSLKALKRGSRLLFIDDFMRGGGTAKGIVEISKELGCEVAGIGVLIETAEPRKKLVDDYYPLLTLYGVDERNGIVDIRPSNELGI